MLRPVLVLTLGGAVSRQVAAALQFPPGARLGFLAQLAVLDGRVALDSFAELFLLRGEAGFLVRAPVLSLALNAAAGRLFALASVFI